MLGDQEEEQLGDDVVQVRFRSGLVIRIMSYGVGAAKYVQIVHDGGLSALTSSIADDPLDAIETISSRFRTAAQAMDNYVASHRNRTEDR